MESFPHFMLGVLGTFALAIVLVLCSASALQAWSSIHQHQQQLRAMSVANGPAITETRDPVSSYWSGRP